MWTYPSFAIIYYPHTQNDSRDRAIVLARAITSDLKRGGPVNVDLASHETGRTVIIFL